MTFGENIGLFLLFSGIIFSTTKRWQNWVISKKGLLQMCICNSIALYSQLLLDTIENFINSLNSKSLRRCWERNPQAFQSRTAKAQEAARELNIQAKDTFKEEQQKKASHSGTYCSFLRKCWKDCVPKYLNEKVKWLWT